MNISRFFVDRPVFAGVLSILIVVAGLIGMRALPISEYPEVVPPSIVVRAVYPGANPVVIAETVATPLEEQINGVEDMLYMNSQATSDGVLTLTVTFKLGTDPDKAQQLVQNRVSQAEPRLPGEVRALGVTTVKSSPDFIMVVNLVSTTDRYDITYLRNYATLNIKDRLARIEGVGQVQVFGAGDYAMRVWIDPQKAAEHSLAASRQAGTLAALALSLRPAAVSVMCTRRSSATSRTRATRPLASSRLSKGVRVPESSDRRSPSTDTMGPSCSHNASITRYCG